MCTDDSYKEFPPVSFGGPTGDYTLDAPVGTARWTEWRLICVSKSVTNGAQFAITGQANNGKTAVVPWDGSVTLTDNASYQGILVAIGPAAFDSVNSPWFRLPNNSQKRLYMRLDILSGGSTSAFACVQFRDKLLTTIPGPNHEVHPDHMEKLNQARAEKTMERLKELGIPAYAEELNANGR